MLKRVVLAVIAASAFSRGAAFALTFAPLVAAQTMVIHASGAGTAVHTSGAVSSQPSTSATPPASSTVPASSVSQAQAPASVSNSAAGAAPSTAAPGIGGGIPPSRGQSGHGGGRTSIAGVSVGIPERKVTVALLNGGQIAAMRMHLGLHDALTVKNGKTVISVALSQIARMEFGEKELGRLAVTVNMVDGSALVGNVYPGTVFEFEGKGRVTATRAEEIATINFPGE